MLKFNATITKQQHFQIILALFYFATALVPLELYIHSSCSKRYAAADEVEY